MLYYLFNYLDQLDFPGAGMFKYVSFRSGLALILSLFISTAIGRRIIDQLQMLQIGETVRNLGLEGQMSKKGTPTMGGIIIIIAILIPTLLCAKLNNIYVILMLVTTVWLGALGFADDYIKVFKKNKEGMHGRFKIVGQVGLGLIVGLVLFMSPDVVIKENMEVRHDNVIEEVRYHTVETKSTKTTIPFLKNNTVGILRIPYSAAISPFSSTSHLPMITCPSNSAANSSMIGATILQGPHQGAQKSTTTGFPSARTSL